MRKPEETEEGDYWCPECGKPFCPIHGALDQDLIIVERKEARK
jgi:hypothetical protein